MKQSDLTKMITKNDVIDMKHKMDKTQDTSKPYAVIDNDNIAVVGDANEIQKVEENYVIKFRVPKEFFEEIPYGATTVDKYVIFGVEYSNASVTGMNDLKIVDALLNIQPFLKEFYQKDEDGKVTIVEKTDREVLKMLSTSEDEVIYGFYKVVAAFLGVDEELIEYMLPFSVIETFTALTENHPEVFKEADAFFG
ncbi:TPA: hypothetical protein ITS76_000622 [Enterococcus faecalis]|uniref:hypothetical protein n=1 Tax=Enterococcus faecalis TaxID=1351 RepID=UPI000330ACB4|nr:hypothetical protein [Enterococcus faecalis]DAU70173.1 MAG TPA: hypothetical protein [Caudoviricetes sp.]EOE02764.1 hypothetical protein Q9K_00371 [Enterococcus faecalis EnGen0075]EOE17979.1 hypothetical protein Q9W_00881 [Enterococcus faecalis EnGen0060]EOE25050.1 hypothetical protein QA5_00571 [Enterococcus faecalis EnGen0083]HAP3036213.1 hypothetical protein [Enterococcus faecalis]